MNARVLGLLGVIAAVGVGCHSDPTNSVVGTPSKLNLQFTTLKVTVGDSFATFATLLDAGATPLSQAIGVTACDPTTVNVVHVASGAPEVQTNFFVKGVQYGTGCVIATVDGLSDTMQVAALPDHISITSGPDTVVSGVSNNYTFAWFDKGGNTMTGVPAPTWTAANSALGTFTDQANGTYLAVDTGVSNVTVSESFSLLGGTVTGSFASPAKTVATIAAAFNGTTNSPVYPGGTLVVTANAGGPQYDSTTKIWFGASAQTTSLAGLPNVVSAPVIDLAAWGPLSMGVKGIGPGEITQVGQITVQAPPAYAGAVSATSVTPATVITLTNGGGDPAWSATSRAYWNGRRAWILDTTSSVAHVLLPPAGAAGKKLLLLTRMGATALAAQDSLTSTTAAPYDQYDAVSHDTVENGPGTGALITGDSTIYITLSGACPSGGPTVGGGSVTTDENCDDWISVQNTSGTDHDVTVTISWQNSGEIGVTQDMDGYWFDDGVNFINSDAATSANPETSTVTVPAGKTYYVLVNLFNVNGLPYALVKVNFTYN